MSLVSHQVFVLAPAMDHRHLISFLWHMKMVMQGFDRNLKISFSPSFCELLDSSSTLSREFKCESSQSSTSMLSVSDCVASIDSCSIAHAASVFVLLGGSMCDELMFSKRYALLLAKGFSVSQIVCVVIEGRKQNSLAPFFHDKSIKKIHISEKDLSHIDDWLLTDNPSYSKKIEAILTSVLAEKIAACQLKKNDETLKTETEKIDIRALVQQEIISCLKSEGNNRVMNELEFGMVVEKALANLMSTGRCLSVSLNGVNELKKKLYEDYQGLGALAPYLNDPEITEIMINGQRQSYVERDGQLNEIQFPFYSREHYLSVIERLAVLAGRRVDFASPICDLKIDGGHRANIVLPPLSTHGPLLTIRSFNPSILTFEDLLESDSLTIPQRDLLAMAVHERKNIFVCGNSGAGKTTLLNLLCEEINARERMITIEDTAELRIRKPHVISLEARQKNAEGVGGVSIHDLVLTALRMRPDRIIVGETRGSEVIAMLQAMNTGHHGSMTTLHANSAQDAISRLEGMILASGCGWPLEAIRRQLVSAIHIIVYLERRGHRRTVVSISNLSIDNDRIALGSL